MENQQTKTIFGHPTGLYILFFTELWERFSYYGMRAILVLYMVTSATAKNAGLGWAEGNALELYGWYTMLVYVMSIPGGIIADKFIGQKRTVLYGGLILVAGHGILAVEQVWAFYTGLFLIVIGVGGLKPNISTMVGGLYPQGDPRRDKGFTIFYIGINVGALLASLVVGYIGETIGWHYGFGLAGIGMLVGQLVYMLGQKHLKGVGEAPSKSVITTQAEAKGEDDKNTSVGKLFSNLFSSPFHLLITLGLSALSVFAGFYFFEGGNQYAYAGLFLFLSVMTGLMMMIYQDINKIEKDRFVVLLLSFLVVIVFWGAFEQAGGLMNLYTKQKINRLVFGYEIPASVFQAVNPLFIILFGTLVANFWLWWRNRGKENSSLYKMAMGTIIMGMGFVFMAIASKEASGDTAAKGMLIWLILAYLFNTIGELSASPVALSFITKVAPIKYVSIMMGFYFAATGLGNKVAGTIGEKAQAEPVHVEVTASQEDLLSHAEDSVVIKGQPFMISGDIDFEDDKISINQNGNKLHELVKFEEKDRKVLFDRVKSGEVENPTAVLNIEGAKDEESGIMEYKAEVNIFELESRREFRTFLGIFGFTAVFGLLLILFLKKLKKLTHGAEDGDDTHHEEQEGFEIADKEDE